MAGNSNFAVLTCLQYESHTTYVFYARTLPFYTEEDPFALQTPEVCLDVILLLQACLPSPAFLLQWVIPGRLQLRKHFLT